MVTADGKAALNEKGRTMSKVREMAEKLFAAEQGPNTLPYAPYAVRQQLGDLWPCDQETYIRMAESVLGIWDEGLRKINRDLAVSQQPLGSEFSAALYDNLSELYEK